MLAKKQLPQEFLYAMIVHICKRKGNRCPSAAREMCWIKLRPLHDIYIPHCGLDIVSREGIRKIVEKFGCFGKLIEIFRQFHDEMTTLRTTIHLRPSNLPTRGVKQGWVLAPALKSPTRRFWGRQTPPTSSQLCAWHSWDGHAMSLPHAQYSIPKQLLYGKLSKDKRQVGRWKRRYKDSLSIPLKISQLINTYMGDVAADRPS